MHWLNCGAQLLTYIVMLRTEIEMTHVNNTAVQSSQYEHIIILIQYSSAVYVEMVVVVCIP